MRISVFTAVTSISTGLALAQTAEPCARVSASLASQAPQAPQATPKINALDAYQCLTSVPVDTEGDLELLDEARLYSQWQTTLTYLKNPPAGYLEPAIDVVAELDNITEMLQQGGYTNEYSLQVDLFNVLRGAHDGHYYFYPDIGTVFSFARPTELTLTSVSIDGASLPKIYLYFDIIRATANSTPSAIASINDIDINDFMTIEAEKNGGQDPDANFNTVLANQAILSYNPAGAAGSFVSLAVYEGGSTTLKFENGTTYTVTNIAASVQDFSRVQNGTDFFEKFCTGPSKNASALTASVTSSSSAAACATGYPSAIAVGPGLSVSGYFLDGNNFEDVAVLSIPTFSIDPSQSQLLQDFSNTVSAVIENATSAGKDKIIIDLRSNNGGQAELSVDAFKQFFPAVEPFTGTRLRATEALNTIGTIAARIFANITTPTQEQVNEGYGDVVNYHVDLNATGQHFSSWPALFGPDVIYGDNYTRLITQDNSNPYTYTSNYTIYGYGDRVPANTTPPFKPENIVLLQDGLCASACAVLTELMKVQGGVKSIVVGGRPQNAPMQGVGRVKGGQILNWADIRGYAQTIFSTVDDATARALAGTQIGAFYNASHFADRASYSGGSPRTGVNVRNFYREGDTTQTPLQFVYEAADCRLWYTPAMIQNVTNVWAATARAQWGADGYDLCVQGSTNGTGSLSSGNITVPGIPILTPEEAGARSGSGNGSC